MTRNGCLLDLRSSFLENIDNVLTCQNACNWLVSSTKTFTYCLDIGHNPFLFPSMKGARATHTTHDLIEDEKRTITLADCLDSLEISRQRGNAS